MLIFLEIIFISLLLKKTVFPLTLLKQLIMDSIMLNSSFLKLWSSRHKGMLLIGLAVVLIVLLLLGLGVM